VVYTQRTTLASHRSHGLSAVDDGRVGLFRRTLRH
jgi:hypothetical protein